MHMKGCGLLGHRPLSRSGMGLQRISIATIRWINSSRSAEVVNVADMATGTEVRFFRNPDLDRATG